MQLGWKECLYDAKTRPNVIPDKIGPHLQIRHDLSVLLLADWNWLQPIVISFNILCPVEFTSNGVEHFIEFIGAHTLDN